MKANDQDIKDEGLKGIINDGFQEEGLASNFTHQVMTKIERLEDAKESKPLLPIWAWIVIGSSFVAAILMAAILGAFPESSTTAPMVEEQIDTYKNEYGQYVLLAFGLLGLVFVERLMNYLKLLKDLNKPSA